MKLRIDQVKETRRAARTVIGEPSRGRKRGAHKTKRPPRPNEATVEPDDFLVVDKFLEENQELMADLQEHDGEVR